ncbi:MAG TPA: ADP-heptose--LPS heptosyltransferase [Schlesneria sp.]|jgi:ADP-heptose:LPS heptosyltransferase
MKKPPKKLVLCCRLCPGDIMTMTVAVHSLHETYPGEYLTDVRTPCPDIWQNNPWITPIADNDPDATRIQMEYPQINVSNQRPVTFVEAYTMFLGEQLQRPLRATTNRPMLYLSDEEKGWVNQIREHMTRGKDVRYWILNAGVKQDFTAKQWPVESYQDVVDRTRGRVQWVQIGESNHDHPSLSGVIDLRGQTNTRQLIRLVYHARGGLGPVTFLQHLCAGWQKPYVCLLGGREPLPWVQYPLQHTLHSLGLLPCCHESACWRSRVQKLDDNDHKNNSLCDWPIIGLRRPVAKCMAMISPQEVISVVERILAA